MKRRILVAIAALVVIPTSSAEAATGTLTKKAAKNASASFARGVCNRMDECEAWGVESASKCSRASRRVVECDVRYWFSGDIVCDDTYRVRLTPSGSKRVTFPYDPDCY